jgi:hypothetical protein
MRRKTSAADQAARGGVPQELLRFRYEDWADEAGDGSPGPHWPDGVEALGLFYAIKAYYRHLEALHAWQAANGLSYAEFKALQAERGIGVAVGR